MSNAENSVSSDKAPEQGLQRLVARWLDYAGDHLTPVRVGTRLDEVKQRAIQAGYATEDSAKEGAALVQRAAREQVIKEQERFFENNIDRLATLARLTGRSAPIQFKGTTIVSIGGGPGDGICEPWFPRLASLVGAHVINYDLSAPHPLDHEMHLYEHRGGANGDIFRLLLNEQTLQSDLADQANITVIECNNLIGNNVSPEVMLSLGVLGNHDSDGRVIAMRQNLKRMARNLLIENGVLAIDDAYYVKRAGELVPVDRNGDIRENKFYPEE